VKTYRFDQYVEDAAVDPYVLEMPNGQDSIVIDYPDGDSLLKLEESSSSRERLKLLLGAEYETAWAAIGKAKGSVMTAIVVDICKHFGLDLQRAPMGGTGASSS
jgi:hypothetical protein